MKVDFVNFILNITGQNERNLDPTTVYHGFCAVDLAPLFDDSASAKTHRDTWWANEHSEGTTALGQKVFHLTSLTTYVQLPSETANGGGGGGSGAFDHPVLITWTLNIPFSSIQSLDAFKAQLQLDYANALQILPSRIQIDAIAPSTNSITHIMATGSKTVVNFQIIPTSDVNQPTAVALGLELQRQFSEPHSPIYNGVYTRNTDTTTNPNVVVDLTNGAFIASPSVIILLIALFAVFFV